MRLHPEYPAWPSSARVRATALVACRERRNACNNSVLCSRARVVYCVFQVYGRGSSGSVARETCLSCKRYLRWDARALQAGGGRFGTR